MRPCSPESALRHAIIMRDDVQFQSGFPPRGHLGVFAIALEPIRGISSAHRGKILTHPSGLFLESGGDTSPVISNWFLQYLTGAVGEPERRLMSAEE
jgi:hypothetical protein